uniref:ANK_REP_REGION domain-containing protein n=1 Tax=Elaeophora elaphi TaxID=1147741 RepID=A0A0R3S2S2_9BILA
MRLEELLKLVENECAPEANALCLQFESIRSSFLQLECDRIKEKLRVLVLQLDRMVDFMAKRKILLLKFKEFQKFVKDAEDTLLRTVHTASFGVEVDMHRTTNEVSAVFDKLDNLGKELTAYQLDANMTIADISIADALNRIKNISLDVGSIEEPVGLSKRFQEFFDVSNQLESAFCTDINTCEHLDNIVEFITVSLENGKKETELMIRLVTIADNLTSHEKAKANDILSKLKRIMDKRQELRRVTVEDCVERSLVILTQKEDQLEAIIERNINDQNLDNFETDEVTKWVLWKEELDQASPLFTLIGSGNQSLTMLIKNSNIKWRNSLDELVEKAANFDARIMRFKNIFAKSKRREQRISAKLAAFAKWVDLMEEDINRAESLDNAVEKAARLRSIYNICLSHRKLVDKLLSSKLDPSNSSKIKFHCDRYFAMLHRTDLQDLPEERAVSNHFADLASSSVLSQRAQIISILQLSLSSLSTSGNENDEDQSHHAEMSSYEGTSSTYALTQRVLQAKETPEIRLLLSEIDSELNVLADSVSRLNGSYAHSLKPLSKTQVDMEQLQVLNERRRQLNTACDNLSRNVSSDDLAVVRSLALHLHSLEEPFTIFMRELQKEIDDEITVQANYEGIAKKLSQLNIDIDQRTRNAIQDVRNQLEHVQSDLNLLRVQCSQRRKYVENTIECVSPDASLSNCSRRKKIMLMVSRTVTTIIQVVEDELQCSSKIKENDLLELKQKLEDVNTSIVDETGAVDDVVLNGTVNKEVQYKIHEPVKSDHIKEQMRVMQSELAQL